MAEQGEQQDTQDKPGSPADRKVQVADEGPETERGGTAATHTSSRTNEIDDRASSKK